MAKARRRTSGFPPRAPASDVVPAMPRDTEARRDANALVLEHAAYVTRALRRAGVSEAMVDDAAQHVFLVVSQKLGAVRPGRERAFLFGVVLNVAAHARRRIARLRETADDAALEVLDEGPLQDQVLEDARTSALVEQVLADLPMELRDVIVRIDLEERTAAEVAEELGLAVGTVASRLRRAREVMAREVGRVHPSRQMRAARRARSPQR